MINKLKQRNRSNLFFKFYFICCFLLTQTFVSSFSSSLFTSNSILYPNLISNVQFTNDAYAGYISENLAPTSTDSSTSSWPSEDASNRQNRNINTQQSNATKSIYVRFVDRLKPAVHFHLSHSKCESVKLDHLNIELTSDFDYESLDLFQLDYETFNCFAINKQNQNESKCFCFLRVSIKDDSTRSRLNREAKDVYLMQLKIKQSSSLNTPKRREPQRDVEIDQVEIANKQTASLKVNILDDNDLEPMFDPSEYNIRIAEFDEKREANEPFLEPTILPAFSVIGKVSAIDPDLSQNGLVRFFLYDKESVCNQFFGINWITGEIYLKQSIQQIFNQLPLEQNEFEFNLEVKAVDYGLKHQIINTLLKTNSISNSRARKTLFSNGFSKHRREREESHEENSDSLSDSVEYKLISLAAQSPPVQSPPSYLNAASLESAFVNIRLIRNAKQVLEREGKLTQFKKLNDLVLIDQELEEQISFTINPNRIPFALVEFPAFFKDTVGKKLDNFLKIKSFFNDSLRFYLNKLSIKSNSSSFLVSFEVDSDFDSMNSQLSNKSHLLSNSINYCLNYKKIDDLCYNMIEFQFDIRQDLVESLHSACHLNLYISESNKTQRSLTLDPIDSKSALFQVRYEFSSRYKTEHDVCDIYLKYKFSQMLLVKYSLIKSLNQEILTIDEKSGLVKVKPQINLFNYLIQNQNVEIEANLLFKNSKFKTIKQFSQRLTVSLQPKINSWSAYTLLSNVSAVGFVKNHQIKLYNLLNNKVVYKFGTKQMGEYELLYCAMKSDNSIEEIEIIPQRQCPFKLSQSLVVFQENELVNKSMFNEIFLLIRANGIASPIEHLTYHRFIFINNQMLFHSDDQVECSVNMKRWEKTVPNEMYSKKPLKLTHLNLKHSSNYLSSLQNKQHIEIDVLNSSIDNECFQLKDDVVYLLCNILPSHTNLEHLTNSLLKRTLNITIFNNFTRHVEHKIVNISFKLMESVAKSHIYSNPKCNQKIQRDEFQLEPLNEENMKQLVQEDSRNQIQLFNEIKSNESGLIASTFVSTLFESSSNKRLNVTYLLNRSLSLNEDSSIWVIDCEPTKLCIYKLIEQENKHNELFKIENGILKSFVRLDFPLNDVIKKAKKSFAYSLRIQVNSFDLFESFSYEIDVDLYFVITDLNQLSDLPVVNLDQYEYLIQVDQSKMAQRTRNNRDVLIFNGFRMHLLDRMLKPSDIYNVSYSVQQIDSMLYESELPFYMDLDGNLFYQINSETKTTESMFEFQVLINFKYIHNSQCTFDLIANFRVNLEQTTKVSFDQSGLKHPNIKSVDISATIDLSLPITSADLFSFVLNCPLIGFLKLTNEQMGKFRSERAMFRLILPEIKSKNAESVSKQSGSKKVSNRARKYSVKSKSKRDYIKESLDEENNQLFQEEIVDIYETNQVIRNSSQNEYKKETTDEEEQTELSILEECFFSHLELDSTTGALYFNLAKKANEKTNEDHVHFYTKIAKLINFYYYERGLMSKMIKIDAVAYNQVEKETVSTYVNLVFKKPPQTSLLTREKVTDEETSTKNKNKFLINSNNLLNLFYNGDEFSIRLDVQENAVTWLDDEFVDENSLLNLRKYFESKLDHRQSLIYMNLINNLRFFLIDSANDEHLISNRYFKIDDNLNGVLLTKLPIQFDYEVSQSYLARVMVVQYLGNDHPNVELTGQNRNEKVFTSQRKEEDLAFDLPKQEETFVYWMDLHVNVVNVVDEPFQCSQPIYFLNMNENQPKNKKLFTIEIEDYEKDAHSDSIYYSAQILNTEETQGYFTMNGLDLQAGTRKLDREVQIRHELDIKVTESYGKNAQSNSSTARYALCKIVIMLNDINDKRPIINELELTVYNKLDSNLIEKMKVPVANGIAIDQDEISAITYSIVSVRILGDQVNRRSYLDESKELSDLFRINETTGFVYASRTEMPCVECTIQLIYKANDEGRLKSRSSRKSSIKFFVRQLPLSLFKINSELDDIYSQHDEQIDAKFATSESSLRTFEFQSTSNAVLLNVSETLKLGEKVYQIKTKPSLSSVKSNDASITSIVYYTLLETGNTNQTFYMSNHDGSLYLIKPLDYETVRTFNLTVLVTNWIGQIEYFNIQINVLDLNDNYPMFTSVSYHLNETLKLASSAESNSNKEKIVTIAEAYDLDLLDLNHLTFKLEDCFYTSSNVLLKKPFIATDGINPATNHLNYPLCSKQFLDLIWTNSNLSSVANQTIQLKLNTQRFNEYLHNSSDFFIKNERATIHFHLDLSVKDSSLAKSSVCRVHLNLQLTRSDSDEQQQLIFTRRDLNKRQFRENKEQRISYGFRNENYFVKVNTLNELSKGTELIRLNDEFVWTLGAQQNFSSFYPFELEFYFGKNSTYNEYFAMEPHFGLIYLKKSVQKLDEHIIELEIGCRPKWIKFNHQTQSNSILFSSASLILAISDKFILNQISEKELISKPIWVSSNDLNASINENEPIGTYLKEVNRMVQLNILEKMIDSKALHDLEVLTGANAIYSFSIINEQQRNFEIDSQYIRTRKELDYEQTKSFELKLKSCLVNAASFGLQRTSPLCFKQTKLLHVEILNRNDNRPTIQTVQHELDLNLSQLMRSMSLFRFSVEDLDHTNDLIEYELSQVLVKTNGCELSELNIDVNSFDLFKAEFKSHFVLKLSDAGFDGFVTLKQLVSSSCYVQFELVCEVNNGVYLAKTSFFLNTFINDTASSLLSIRDNVMAPIIHSIELTENLHVNQSNEYLIDMNTLLTNYLKVNMFNFKLNEGSFDIKGHLIYTLKNYEDVFWLNQESSQLNLRKRQVKLDREQRETYELFIELYLNESNENSNLFKQKHLIPFIIRINVKLSDVNDNKPQFVHPPEVIYTKLASDEIREPDLFFYNQTVRLDDLVRSNETQPILALIARDADVRENALVFYHLNCSADLKGLFHLSSKSGHLYVSNKANRRTHVESVLQKYKSPNETSFKVNLQVIAQDNGRPRSLQSILNIQLTIRPDTMGLYFKQSFYYFKVTETIELRKVIGYINSAEYFTDSVEPIVYSIVEGNYLDTFDIDYTTGALSTRARLDFETSSSFFLTIQAYNSFANDQYANASVRIDVIDANDNAPRFDQYEYQVSIDENMPKMSALFHLNATDLDEENTRNSRIRYKLVNELDNFYVNELTGWVYNKNSFDFKRLGTYPMFHLKIIAYDLGVDSLETSCLLTIHIRQSNSQAPKFERSVYSAQIQVEQSDFRIGEASLKMENSSAILNMLLNNSTFDSFDNSIQFVSKVEAKDADSDLLHYSIVKQVDLSHENSIASLNIFKIDATTGIVYLDLNKYQLLTKFYAYQQASLEKSKYELHLMVCDALYCAFSRLNVQLTSAHANDLVVVPKFAKTFVRFNLNLAELSSNQQITLSNLSSNVDLSTSSGQRLRFQIELDTSVASEIVNIFTIEQVDLLQMNVKMIKRLNTQQKSYLIYQVPISVCAVSTSLCDQMLFFVNISNLQQLPGKTSKSGTEKTGFAYNYWSVTLQQEIVHSPSDPSSDYSEDEYDYYYIDDIYEPKDRFYFEIKTSNELDKESKYEFEMANCVYSSLNANYTNETIHMQIKKLLQSSTQIRLSQSHLKSLFSLNKFNGVLSSRKVINSLLPGVYLFNIKLKFSAKWIDSMRFKLIILPANDLLSATSKYLYNHFKFDKEFYKFQIMDSNRVNLINKHDYYKQMNTNRLFKLPKLSNYSISYKLISGNRNPIHQLLTINEQTGVITYTNSTLDENELKSMLNKNEELVGYILAKVQLESNNSLEYMCELSFSFKQIDDRHESIVHRTDSNQAESLIQFGKSLYKLQLKQKLKANIPVFRFIAWTDHLDDLFHVKYSLLDDESNSFEIDLRTGQLKTIRNLDKYEFKLNISACIYSQCASSYMVIDVYQAISYPPVFSKALYSANVQEDVLPGTIITTVDLERRNETNSKVDFFIINGDPLSQFAISSDGKVYTRSLIDREKESFYSLDILAFDGKYKSLTKININVLDVLDNRLICLNNYVKLDVNENLPIGQTVHRMKVLSLEKMYNLKFDIIEDDEENRIPFKSNLIPFEVVGNELRVNADLDFELNQSYLFFVRAAYQNRANSVDKTFSCLFKFEINLIDQNDNPPKFSKANYTTSLLENSPRGTILTPKIEAIDLDSGEFGIIRYSLQNGHDLFKIDSNSGLITLNTNQLDRELVGNWFNLTIRASNQLDLFTDVELFINLIDVNDNLPQFDRSEYFVSIEENMSIGFLILSVQAQDSDSSSTIYYHLLDDNTNVFALNKLTGDITVNGTLDYEVKSQYQLRILASESDSAEAVGSIARLVVDLIDVNDNYPQFDEKTPTQWEISENTPTNTTILIINGFDLDKSERNSRLMYSLNDDARDFFDIDRETGRLFNKVVFDYEIGPLGYNLTIELSDAGLPYQLKNSTKLTILIKDLNDNHPQFLRVNQTVIINENYPFGQSITKLQINDLDSVNEGGAPFTFNIMNQFKLSNQSDLVPVSSPLFNINPNGSLILIDKPISNQTYIIQLRCYDSGLVEPLYSDSFITVKITDELNSEPQMNDSIVNIVTVGSSEFDSDSIAKIFENQPIFELKAFDVDTNDQLFYELFDLNATRHFQVDSMSGVLRAQHELMKSHSYKLKASVTDKKFATESNLHIHVQNVKDSCLTNSMFIRFDIGAEHSTIEFSHIDAFLERFKEVTVRLLQNRNQRQKLNMHILGFKLDESDGFDSSGTIVEILFAIYKPNENCLNAKQISKVLNRRRPLLIRRMKTSLGEQHKQQQQIKIKLIDITYNNECFFGPLKSVCTTNAEIQNCKLKFTGYNKQMCVSSKNATLNRCLLLPKYDWLCDEYFQITTQMPSISYEVDSEPEESQAVKKKLVISCKEPHNPCLNNGVCKQIKVASLNSSHNGNVKSRLTCLCPNGFKGKFCEEDVNECDLEYQKRIQKQTDLSKTHLPCATNAQCINIYGSFRCNCSEAQSSLCYNTAHYSASGLQMNEFFLESDEKSDDQYDEESTKIKTIFGQISARTIRHALLGLFAGICVILILLSLAAGVVCRMNMNQKRRALSKSRERFKRREENIVSIIESTATPATTSNASEAFSSSSTSSPGSYNKKLDTSSKNVANKGTRRNFVRNKQRSSMTTSLLSNDTITGQMSTRRRKSSNLRYKINNLLFGARFHSSSNRKSTNTTLLEEDEYLRNSNKNFTSSSQGGTSSIYESTNESSSPATTPTNNIYGTLKNKQIKLDLSVVESSCLLEKDDEDYFDSADSRGNEQSIKLLTLNSNQNKENQTRSDNDADDEEELKSEQKKLLDINNSLVVPVDDVSHANKIEKEFVSESSLYSSFQKKHINKFNTVCSSRSKPNRLNTNEPAKSNTLIRSPSFKTTPQALKPISIIKQNEKKTEIECSEEDQLFYDTLKSNSDKTHNRMNALTTIFQPNNDQLNDSINTENCSQGK
jgi:hypothetical protein